MALHRVTFVVRKDFRPTKQPDNIDYLSVIRDLHKELRRPLRAQWIKGHQDDQRQSDTLSPDAKLNIAADKLVTDFHNLPRAKPMKTTEHIAATKISITINHIRYSSNIDDNIRFQINGGYIRRFLQAKHKCSNTTWDSINLPAFGRHLKSPQGTYQIHSQQITIGSSPTSTRNHQGPRYCPMPMLQRVRRRSASSSTVHKESSTRSRY